MAVAWPLPWGTDCELRLTAGTSGEQRRSGEALCREGLVEGEERWGQAVTRPERRAGAGPGSLTGAGVVLEGADAVPVRCERAHALSGVRQPALDRPVGAARVHVLVRELRRRREVGGGEVGGSEPPPSLSLSKGGGARSGETA